MGSLKVGNNQLDLDQDIAIKEVSRVFDLMKKLQALIQFKTTNGSRDEAMHMHELAQSLFGESLQALNHALCVMKSKNNTKIEIKQEISLDGTGSPACSRIGSPISNDSDDRIENRKGKRRRVEDYSWTNTTSMPYDDGYQWRKYGEKKISGSGFPRGYFRCTYKDEQNCQATKLVQQKDNKYPPLFDVKYANKHTCNSFNKQIVGPSQTNSNPFSSLTSFNGSNQIVSLQDYNHQYMIAQADHESSNKTSPILHTQDCNLLKVQSSDQASCLQDDCNLKWDTDMDSLLMNLRWFEEDDFLLRSLESCCYMK